MSKRNILSINVDEETGYYHVVVPTGSNVAETAFAMSVVIRCFVKDKIVEDTSVVTDMIHKYLTDSQYDELEENYE